MAVLGYVDKPGVIGVIGKLLGDRGVNIAGMQVGRDAKGGKALTVLTVDFAIAQDDLETLGTEIGAGLVRQIELAD